MSHSPTTTRAIAVACFCLLGTGLLLACAPDPLPGEPNAPARVDFSTANDDNDPTRELAVLTLDDREITIGEIEDRTMFTSQIASVILQVQGQRLPFTQALSEMEILANAARASGSAAHPFVSLNRDISLARAGQQRLHIGTSFSDVEVEARAFIEQQTALYGMPELRTAVTVVVATREEAEQVRVLLDAIRFPQYADDIVARYSIDSATRATGGDMGFFAHDGDVNREIADAVFAMINPGETSPPIHTERGWEVVIYQNQRQRRLWTFNIAGATVSQLLVDERNAESIRELLDEQRQTQAASIDQDVLATLNQSRVVAPQPLSEFVPTDIGSLPRRFSVDGLARNVEMVLGEDWLPEVVNWREAPLANPGPAPIELIDVPAGTDVLAPAPTAPTAP